MDDHYHVSYYPFPLPLYSLKIHYKYVLVMKPCEYYYKGKEYDKLS